MDIAQVKELYEKYVLQTYTKTDLCLVKGKGAKIEDISGKKFLDFFPGWAVSGIGHCHPKVVKNVARQCKKILHVSNNYYNELQGLLAERIIKASIPGRAFFCNSGAEANEGAIKLARKYGNPKRYEIITMEKSFHGRTLATITATGQDKIKIGFEPLVEGFKHIPYGNIDALISAVSEKTIAVMLELIQGEGGINVASPSYIKQVREICDKRDLLLIIDEVQTGMGRTGKMFSFQHYDIKPDCFTLAKSLGGGLPIGAMVVSERFKDVLTPGSHASTFGGSPIVCAASLGVFEAIEKENLLENTVKMGAYFKGRLERFKEKFGFIKQIKGIGLMIGIELDLEDANVVFIECLRKGLLINCTQKNILRVMPPITVSKKEIDKALSILEGVLKKI